MFTRKSYLEILVLVSLHVSMDMNLYICDVERENNLIFIALQPKEEPKLRKKLARNGEKEGQD